MLYLVLIMSHKYEWPCAWLVARAFDPARLEAAKDDYRIHCEELEEQLVEVQHRNDELTSLAEESRSLKDELDILRSACRTKPACSKRRTLSSR